ncbi:MAG: T9SS type A sorting domain-containing protein, partial [Bacteroidales bacterium]|nr:T9SS type A sorting domain-containing protein [Bacteroidales bacterium]
ITFPNNWRDFCNHLEKTTFLRFTTNDDPEPQSCEITIDGKSKEYPIQQDNSVEIDQLPSLPGEYKCKALFKGESYNKELDFTLTITAVENMIMQLYKNVIFVNNACRRFETYQWYRYNNDEELANGKRQYFTEPTLSGSYYTLINGYIHACPWETPATIKKNSPSVTTYPNPAAEGKPFTIEISDYEPGTEYTLRIYNSSGNIVLKQRVADKTTTISLPQGIYTGAVISNGEKMTFKVIVR